MKVPYGVIYLAQCVVTGKSYVGQAINFEKRKNHHIQQSLKGSGELPKFYAAIRKYGPTAFVWSILQKCFNKKDLDSAEKLCIRKLKSRKNGYNCTVGGDGLGGGVNHPCFGIPGPWRGKKFSKRHCENIGKAQIGKKLTKETRKRMSSSQMGHICSNETRLKLRTANLGHVISDDQKLKLRNAGLANWKSNKYRKHMVAVHTGKKLPEEQKIKMRLAQRERRIREGRSKSLLSS